MIIYIYIYIVFFLPTKWQLAPLPVDSLPAPLILTDKVICKKGATKNKKSIPYFWRYRWHFVLHIKCALTCSKAELWNRLRKVMATTESWIHNVNNTKFVLTGPEEKSQFVHRVLFLRKEKQHLLFFYSRFGSMDLYFKSICNMFAVLVHILQMIFFISFSSGRKKE